MDHQKVLSFPIPKLILITDSQRLSDVRFFSAVEAALQGGVDTILLREKQMDSARLLAFSSKLREMTALHGAKLIIHTQADIARAVSADGVHLSSLDMNELPAIRKWIDGEGVTISISCHNEMELEFASRFGADFVFLSPVFPTKSHPGKPALGVEQFKELAEASSVPVIALGGITPENRSEISGYGVAVIGAILDAAKPEAAARNLLTS